MCHFINAPIWSDRCDIEGAPGDRGAKGGRLSFGTRPAQTQAHHVRTISAKDAMMNRDYGQISHEAMAQANAISEISIFWGMIITVLVVVAGMLKGMVG
jgi:hypothetical protein